MLWIRKSTLWIPLCRWDAYVLEHYGFYCEHDFWYGRKLNLTLYYYLMNLIEKFTGVKNYFSPLVIGEVNDVYVKLVKIKGDDIPWHSHKDEDELFYIIEGNLLFEIKGESSFTMKQGDLFIVKKNIAHRVSSLNECKIMLIENKATLHTGDVKSAKTKTIIEQL